MSDAPRKIVYTVDYWEGYNNTFHTLMTFETLNQAEVWAMYCTNPKPIFIHTRAVLIK